MLTGTDTHIRLPLPNKGKTNASAYGLGDALIDADGTYGWIADGNQYFWVTLEIHDASEKAAYESDPYDTAAGAFVVSGLSYGKYTTGTEAPSYKRGDVNNDGVVDEADLLAIRRHISAIRSGWKRFSIVWRSSTKRMRAPASRLVLSAAQLRRANPVPIRWRAAMTGATVRSVSYTHLTLPTTPYV